jgi:hypothetical protein
VLIELLDDVAHAVTLLSRYPPDPSASDAQNRSCYRDYAELSPDGKPESENFWPLNMKNPCTSSADPEITMQSLRQSDDGGYVAAGAEDIQAHA